MTIKFLAQTYVVQKRNQKFNSRPSALRLWPSYSMEDPEWTSRFSWSISHPALQEQSEKDRKFKACLCYTVGSNQPGESVHNKVTRFCLKTESVKEAWGCSSAVEMFIQMHEALDSMPKTSNKIEKKKQTKKGN